MGLAHFHEHMLFLGTEKYPEEDEYNRYLREHGGDSNAYTMSEYTTYYFKVASPFLQGALDRFAQFFIQPSFDPSCVEREMQAVDSESTNYSTEDGWRLLQVLKTTASDEHPFHRFDVGNLKTLGADNPSGTRKQLIQWNHEHYQAGAMRLAIVGKESLSELAAVAEGLFDGVRSGAGVLAEAPSPSPAWPEGRLGSVISCVPLKEARSVAVYWPLPPQSAHPFAKPELCISHVLGHEGHGSLHEVLNQRGWVDQLSAGTSHSFTDGQLFALTIGLTPEGDANREEVLELVFEYLGLVQREGPQESTFQELASLQEIAFAHKEDSPMPDDFAAAAAMSLHKYTPSEALRGPFAVDEWRPDVVAEYLSSLQPERCLVFLTSPAFEAEAAAADAGASGWCNEHWYGARYRQEPIGEARLARWRAARDGHASEGLGLPEPNCFVPRDFSLRGEAEAATRASRLPLEVAPPGLLRSDPLCRLWHKVDRAFRSPREYVLAHIHCPAYRQGPHAVAMMRLFCSVIADDLNTLTYDASVAGLGYSLDFSDNLSLSVGGFSNRLPDLLDAVLARIRDVLDSAERAADAAQVEAGRAAELLERLETQRQLLLQDYQNFTREEPWAVCSYYCSQVMLPGTWHLSEYIDVLQQPASLSDMAVAVRRGLEQAQLEVLVHGNASETEAAAAAEALTGALGDLGARAWEAVPRQRVTRLEAGADIVFEYDLGAENAAQENSCTQNVYQVGVAGEDPHRDACLSVLCNIASTSAYQQLRTEEQLGYIVQAGIWAEQFVVGLCAIVQGTRLAPCEADARIEAWLAKLGEELEAMGEEELTRNVQAVVSERSQRHARLAQETAQHWAEIQPRRYRFDRLRLGIEALKSLSKADVLAFYRAHVAAGAPERRKLSLRVLGTSAQKRTEGAQLATLQDIRDLHSTSSIFEAPPPADVPFVAGQGLEG